MNFVIFPLQLDLRAESEDVYCSHGRSASRGNRTGTGTQSIQFVQLFLTKSEKLSIFKLQFLATYTAAVSKMHHMKLANVGAM